MDVEITWRVPPLPPDAAGRLFVDRAAQSQPGFSRTADNATAIDEIARRLDGIPLAVELAAARVRSLAPGEIAAALESRFELLSSGFRTAPPRHRTLRGALGRPGATTCSRTTSGCCSAGCPCSPRVSASTRSAWTSPWAMSCHGDRSFDLLLHLVDKSLLASTAHVGSTRFRDAGDDPPVRVGVAHRGP